MPSSGEHILLTGGTGFIGSRLVPALLSCGHQLTVLTRQTGFRGNGSLRHVNRLNDPADWPYTAIINLAGENLFAKRWTARQKQRIRDSRIAFTDQLLSGSDRAPHLRRLLSGSAIGFYGPRGEESIKESESAGADFAAKLCADWEQAARAAQSDTLPVCCVRIGVVLGQGGGALANLLPLFRRGLGGRIGSGRQWLSWIHVDDLVAIFCHLATSATLPTSVNATAPEPVRNRDFSDTLGAVLNRPTLIPTPGIALKLMLGEVSSLLLTGQRVLPAELKGMGFRFQHRDIQSALMDICINGH